MKQSKEEIYKQVKIYQKTEKGKAALLKAKIKHRYKNLYGITLEDYNNMFASQNGCCKICGTHQSELSKALSVDHCHNTLKVRGLLCGLCNTSLGGFKDNIDLLTKAIEYLTK